MNGLGRKSIMKMKLGKKLFRLFGWIHHVMHKGIFPGIARMYAFIFFELLNHRTNINIFVYKNPGNGDALTSINT